MTPLPVETPLEVGIAVALPGPPANVTAAAIEEAVRCCHQKIEERVGFAVHPALLALTPELMDVEHVPRWIMRASIKIGTPSALPEGHTLGPLEPPPWRAGEPPPPLRLAASNGDAQ